jgi:hypothetical protein
MNVQISGMSAQVKINFNDARNYFVIISLAEIDTVLKEGSPMTYRTKVFRLKYFYFFNLMEFHLSVFY